LLARIGAVVRTAKRTAAIAPKSALHDRGSALPVDGIHYDGLGRIAGEDYSPCLASQPTAQRRRVVGRITFDTNAAPVDLYLNRRAGCLLNASSGGMRALNPSTISSTTAATLGTHSSTNPGRLCPSLDATGQQSVTQSEDWYKAREPGHDEGYLSRIHRIMH